MREIWRLQRYREWFSQVAAWFTWLVLGAAVVAYAVLLLGWVDEWKILIPLAILLLIGFVRLIVDLGKTQEDLQEELRASSLVAERIETRVRSIEAGLKEFVGSQPTRLLTSGECFKDLNRELERVRDAEEITIRLLALGLGRGRDYLREAVEMPPVDCRLHFEVLVISDAYLNSQPTPPKRLSLWCAHSNDAVAALVDGIQSLENLRPNVGLELRRYSAWPFVHGVAMVQPVEVVYCTLCRWHHGQYDSSLRTYRKIKDPPLRSDRADDAVVFLSFFEHLWQTSENTRQVVLEA